MGRRALATALFRHLGSFTPKRWHGLVAFNYHRIGDPTGSPFDHVLWSASVEELDAQVDFLRREYDVVHPAEVPSLRQGRRGRHAMITFDDGYRDNYDLALPVLRHHGVPATFFVTTGFLDGGGLAWWDEIAWMVLHASHPRLDGSFGLASVDLRQDADSVVQRLVRTYKQLPAAQTKPFLSWLAEATGAGRCPPGLFASQWMTWDMVRELLRGGMAVGGHSVTHPVLARLDRAGQEREISGCAKRLLEELGEPMRWFAYPVGGTGAFDAITRTALDAAGVQLAFSYYGGCRRYDEWDRLDVRRIGVEPYLAGRHFRAVARWPMLTASIPGQRRVRRARESLRALFGR